MLQILFIFTIGLGASFLWDTSLLLPFKLLVVLVHEIWHGWIALLGGGLLEGIHIDLSEAGETIVSQLHSDPFLFLTVSSGYIGSALTGGFLIYRGLNCSYERVTLAFFVSFLAYMSYLFTETGSLAFYTGIGWAFALGLCILINRLLSRYVLLFIGTLFVWYSFYDLLDFTSDAQQTDAGILANYMITENWLLAVSKNPEQLTIYISLFWSLLTISVLVVSFYPAWKAMDGVQYSIPNQEIAEQEEFSPPSDEVSEWLSSKGLQWDGQAVSTIELGEDKTFMDTDNISYVKPQ